jgi:5-methylcytosine-specific restriction endonuclease McrA
VPYKDPAAQSAYQTAWVASRRKAWFDEHPCVDCGTAEGLELDHVDPAQKVSHRIWSWSAERREGELAKCVSRCTPCHDAKTLAGGEYVRGEAHGNSRLTEERVLRLRQALRDGENIAALAREFGVNRYTALLAARGDTWRHLGV